MRHVFRGLPASEHRIECALAIGNFDGVHRGHQKLLSRVRAAAQERGLVSAVLTFEPHPREFFGANGLIRISTLRDKVDAILRCGIERIYILPFNQELASLEPREFVQKILCNGLACRWVSVGENFRFGARRAGDFDALKTLAAEFGCEASCTELLLHEDERISSTRIREAMQAGDMEGVRAMLGRPYTLTGHVIHGAELGRQLNFPTLNMTFTEAGSKAQCALHGSFAVRVHGLAEDGSVLGGVASMGFKPTVTDQKRWLLETNVFDWSGDAYGKLLKVEFVEKLRDEKKFGSLDELKAAIAADAVKARGILGL